MLLGLVLVVADDERAGRRRVGNGAPPMTIECCVTDCPRRLSSRRPRASVRGLLRGLILRPGRNRRHPGRGDRRENHEFLLQDVLLFFLWIPDTPVCFGGCHFFASSPGSPPVRNESDSGRTRGLSTGTANRDPFPVERHVEGASRGRFPAKDRVRRADLQRGPANLEVHGEELSVRRLGIQDGLVSEPAACDGAGGRDLPLFAERRGRGPRRPRAVPTRWTRTAATSRPGEIEPLLNSAGSVATSGRAFRFVFERKDPEVDRRFSGPHPKHDEFPVGRPGEGPGVRLRGPEHLWR